MRKLIRLGLVLGVLTAALTCTALAAGTSTEGFTTAKDGCTVTYSETEKNYTAAYTGAKPYEQCVLLVVEGTEESFPINEDTIMYIDQKAADGSGTVSFDFIPKKVTDCVVLLGGVFQDGVESPVLLGTLIGQGVTVSGSVTSLENEKQATVSLYSSEKALLQTTTTDTTGAYSFNTVPTDGTYYIVAEKGGYVGSPITVKVEESEVTGADITLFAGDINASGDINAPDLVGILNDFNKTGNYANPYSDLNGKDGVNAVDLLQVLNNYNRETIGINEYGG